MSLTDALRLSPSPGAGYALLGLAGDQLTGRWVNTAEHRVLTVAGPRRSGRSTALATITASLALGGAKVALVPRSGARPAALLAAVGAGVDLITRDGLAGAIGQYDVLAIDDADVGGIDDRVAATLGAPGAPVLIGVAEPSQLTYPRGFLTRLAAARAGVILSPAGRLDCLGVSIPAKLGFTGPPGRAYVIQDGDYTLGQVPEPPP
jgi:S-DNA-T family DNA segregation ATPase FtsK/SpoIIIE